MTVPLLLLTARRFTAALLLLGSTIGLAQPVSPALDRESRDGETTPPAAPPVARVGPVEAEDLRSFFDDLFAEEMAANSIPGLAAVLVHRGKVIYTGSYGFSDVERQVPVDAATTVFPFGSISKVFTTIAVLQLVEQGRLDLHTGIDRYVAPLAVDRSFPEPVTLHQILAHTDGFDVRWLFGGATTNPGELKSLRELLTPLPPRIEPPGQLYLYSDVGISLAGYALEQVTGSPFSEYMEAQVLPALGLAHSSFRPWASAAMREARATGYEDTYDGHGTNRPLPVAYPQAVAAAGLSGPVTDLVPLLQAQLAGGRPGPGTLLSPQTAPLLATRQFSHHPGIPGTCFGFYEYRRHGQRGLLHGGLMLGFTSVVFLLPEHDLGLAVVANKFGLVALLEERMLQRFLDRYYPGDVEPEAAVPPVPNSLRERALRYNGLYRTDQYSRRSAEKIALASGWGSEIGVRAAPDGRLELEPGGWWREIGPDLFEQELTRERIAFRPAADGRPARLVGSPQFMSYHRVSWLERLPVQASWAGALALLILLGTLSGGLLALRNAWQHGPRAGGRVRWVRWLSSVTALLVLGAVGGLYFTMRRIGFATAFLGEIPVLRFALQLPFWFALSGLLALGLALLTPSTAWPARAERWAYLLAGLAAALFIPVLLFWNLLAVPVSI